MEIIKEISIGLCKLFVIGVVCLAVLMGLEQINTQDGSAFIGVFILCCMVWVVNYK